MEFIHKGCTIAKGIKIIQCSKCGKVTFVNCASRVDICHECCGRENICSICGLPLDKGDLKNDYQECVGKLMSIGILSKEESEKLTDRVLQETIITGEQKGNAFKSVFEKINNCKL